MPIAPKPFKLVCSKCQYSKVVKPKSDCLNPLDFINKCPKCSSEMIKKELSLLDKLLSAI